MAKKNRNTLKNYFKIGRLPSQEQFGDLIDSMLNVIDEGFDKSAEEGFKISQLGDSGKLISFYENILQKSPVWSIRLDLKTGNLFIDSIASEKEERKAVLSLGPEGKIGINKKDPEFEIDVEGVVAASGRIGRKGEKEVAADGQWHDITEPLSGCHAFEIMAGVEGGKGSGKYALLHAFALNAFNAKESILRRIFSRIFCLPDSKITYHQAHYGSRCNRLKLRWNGESRAYSLQLKTNCCYGDGISVKYYLTKLWFDPFVNDRQKTK